MIMEVTSKKTLKRLRSFHEIMPLQLIRKLSFRNRKSSTEKEPSLRKISSSRGLQKADESANILPDDVLKMIIDAADPIEQIRMRAVSRAFRQHVDEKMNKITKLDVRKTDLHQATTSDWSHMEKAQIALRLEGDKAEIVVDTKWTARDIQAVVGMMSVFRKSTKEAFIDAPIAELLVVSLSAMDLNRWYAFQCYMKAMDVLDADMHLECNYSNPGQVRKSQVYWPAVEYLTIRTTEKQAPHLARVIDYGVQCNWVLDRQTLDRLRIEFTDLDATSREIKRHLYHFRCWAGSAGFDHRFEQTFKPREVLI